ncbi:hypothetical protein [Roseibium sp.]|uniref:hypothetical protein n=1 Tax=Roseibium sp. TaxID=1936156 RepID=UPI003C7D1383
MRVPNRIFAVATLLLWSEQVIAQDLQLSVPLQCSLGVDCFVQNYVDIDPGQAVLAADCGQASYNGHKGTDFRVLNTRVAADVLAAAPGTVRALRNDMADRLVRTKEDRLFRTGNAATELSSHTAMAGRRNIATSARVQ